MLVIIASVSKIVPVTIATKIFSRRSWYYCASMGVLMNTRGIVQLVVLNIGVQLKVISPVIFAMFVLMATILTLATSPILSFLYKRDSDRKVLEESKTAHDLHLALEGEINLENKSENGTIDNDEIIPPKKRSANSIKTISDGRSYSIAIHPRPSSSGHEISTVIKDNALQRKCSRMTLF